MSDKTEYFVHIKDLKQALNHWLVLKKVHRITTFDQKAWIKPSIDMKYKKKSKNDFQKYIFKSMNNENMRKHRDIEPVTTKARNNHLVSESNYHTTKNFSENLLAIEIIKTKICMNKPLYLGLSILEGNKIVDFCYDCVKKIYSVKTDDIGVP